MMPTFLALAALEVVICGSGRIHVYSFTNRDVWPLRLSHSLLCISYDFFSGTFGYLSDYLPMISTHDYHSWKSSVNHPL